MIMMWKRSILYTVRLLATTTSQPATASGLTSYNSIALRGLPLCHARSSFQLPGQRHQQHWSETTSVTSSCRPHSSRTISSSTSSNIKSKHRTEQSRCSSTESNKGSNLDSKHQADDLSSETEPVETSPSDVDDNPPVDETSLSIFQRFKQAYKEHGKVLIGVHLVTSSVWFGSFYYAASRGIDVVPWLEQMGLSEKIISPFKNSSLGDIAMAYLMYKLATPARYAVTLAGTNLSIKHFRRTGRMQPLSEGDRLRELYQDGKGQIKEKTDRLKEVQIEKFQQKVTKKR